MPSDHVSKAQAGFKPPPKKHQPQGLTILHEDRDILVVNKASGLLTMGTEQERERTAYYRLNVYVRKGVHKSRNRVFIVHRLDRDTSGVLVFAKSESAQRTLQENWGNVEKTYYAIVEGCPRERAGEIRSYLAESKTFRVYSVQDPEAGQLARTAYRVVRELGPNALLEVTLHSGRKNQIRVHLADIGHPVVGDAKYGTAKKTGAKGLALHAFSLTLIHPHTRRPMTFHAPLPKGFLS
jgi:tRNA pseudouridine32 synthase/23S rRNA pseudouridine746 synthase/23S rRNA pseudouridine1911/1915/1917 synthase